MKKTVLLFLIIIFSSCRPEAQNDNETLNKIFSSGSFKFEIYLQGCFAQSLDHFTLEKQEKGYLLICKETKKSKYLSNEKITAFKSLLANLLASKKEKHHETGYFSIKVSNFFNAVEYNKSDRWIDFNEILKFSDIIPNP
jgi:hypothetical protein